MRNKLVIIFAFVFTFAVSANAAAEISAEKRRLIVELMELSHCHATGAEFLLQMVLLAAPAGQVPGKAQLDALRNEMASDGKIRGMVQSSFIDIFDRSFSEKDLKSLISFFKGDLGRRYSSFQLELATEGRQRLAGTFRQEAAAALELSRRRKTAADARTLASAVQQLAANGSKLPAAGTIEEVAQQIGPALPQEASRVDAWGRPFAFSAAPGGKAFRIVSAGADGTIDPRSTAIGSPANESDDVVIENGQILQPADAK